MSSDEIATALSAMNADEIAVMIKAMTLEQVRHPPCVGCARTASARPRGFCAARAPLPALKDQPCHARAASSRVD